MTEKKTDYRTLGISFLVIGIGVTVSLSTTLGPAFLGIGLPFVILGIIFMSRSNTDASAEGDE